MEFRLIYTSSNKKLTDSFPYSADIATDATKNNCRFFYITNPTFVNKITKNKINLDVSEELNIVSADLYKDFLSTVEYPVPVLKYELADPTDLVASNLEDISSFVTAYNALTKEPNTNFQLDSTKCGNIRKLYALVLVKKFDDEDIRLNEKEDCKVYSLYELTQSTGKVVATFSTCPNRANINTNYAQIQGHIPFGKDMKKTIRAVGNLLTDKTFN